MGALHDVVRQLVSYGPARNDAEREQLLALVDADEAAQAPASAFQVTSPAAGAPSYPPPAVLNSPGLVPHLPYTQPEGTGPS